MSVPRQPRHRRPSFMRDANTYRMHLQSQVVRHKKEDAVDSNLDGYSYDPEFYPPWSMSQELRDVLPKDLAGVVEDWSFAAAAVQTSLTRIALLDHEGMERGWPDKPLPQQSSASSDATSLVFPSPPSSATSPHGGPFSMHDEADGIRIPGAYPGPHTSLLAEAAALVASPPCSGEDTKLPEALYIRPQTSVQSSVTTSFGQDSTPASSFESTSSSVANSQFDATAWERYLDEYQREVDGLGKEDLSRFRHLAHRIDFKFKSLQPELAGETQSLFSRWWTDMTAKIETLSTEVERVSVPTLTEIQHVRKVYGLHV